jgi:hypothetical protein
VVGALALLLKVCSPDGASPEQAAADKKEMTKRYKTFCLLGFNEDEPLTSLPLEYKRVNDGSPTPAFVMKQAPGQVLA